MHVLIGSLIFSLFIGMALTLNCTVHQQSDGSTLCKLSEEVQFSSNCGIDWSINGINVANEEEINTTVVIRQTRDSLLLIGYHANITFNEDCTATRPRKVLCNGPVSGPTVAPHKEDSTWKIWAYGVPVCFLGLISLLAVGCCWWKKRKGGMQELQVI